MSIAQRLCNEIVEPALQPPTLGAFGLNTQSRRSLPQAQGSGTNRRYPSTASRSRTITVPKKGAPSKFTPRDVNYTKSITRPKAKENETQVSKKTVLDKADNTPYRQNQSGTLLCDNECLTNIRKRDVRISCLCSPVKINCKASVKQIQTQNNRIHLFVDKACSQVIETVSCATQFEDMLDNASKHQQDKTKVMVNQQTMASVSSCSKKSRVTRFSNESCKKNSSHSITHLNNINFSCKRWALGRSQSHNVRGPDF